MVIDNQVHAGDPDLSIKHRLLDQDQLHNGARGLHRVAVDLVGDLRLPSARGSLSGTVTARPEKPKYSMWDQCGIAPSTALNCASPLTGKAAKWVSTGRTLWQQSARHV